MGGGCSRIHYEKDTCYFLASEKDGCTLQSYEFDRSVSWTLFFFSLMLVLSTTYALSVSEQGKNTGLIISFIILFMFWGFITVNMVINRNNRTDILKRSKDCTFNGTYSGGPNDNIGDIVIILKDFNYTIQCKGSEDVKGSFKMKNTDIVFDKEIKLCNKMNIYNSRISYNDVDPIIVIELISNTNNVETHYFTVLK